MNGLEKILEEIKKSIDAELFYVGLNMVLTLPELCARLELDKPSEKYSKDIYPAWFESNLKDKYPDLSGLDCYYLRCGVAHRAQFSNEKLSYDKVLFTIPAPQNIVCHNNVINKTLNLDLVRFCEDMINAVEMWLKNNSDNQIVMRNLDTLVSMKKNGLVPYIKGVPLIS